MNILDKLIPFKSRPNQRHFDRSGRRALIVTSSQKTLDRIRLNKVEKGKQTGVHASELTEPYMIFKAAGMDVDIASIKGGKIPFDPFSLRPFIRTSSDQKAFKDQAFIQKIEHSLPIGTVKADNYDLIFISGGFAAAYDLEQSEELAALVSAFYAQKKVIASVCHGALGLCSATKPDGSPLIKGLNISGVSNRQIRQLGISFTPKHPEDSIKAAGAHFKAQKRLLDIFSHHIEIEKEERIVTGQNQRAGIEAAQAALDLL